MGKKNLKYLLIWLVFIFVASCLMSFVWKGKYQGGRYGFYGRESGQLKKNLERMPHTI